MKGYDVTSMSDGWLDGLPFATRIVVLLAADHINAV